jgi:hypothetical protein
MKTRTAIILITLLPRVVNGRIGQRARWTVAVGQGGGRTGERIGLQRPV